MQFAHVTWNKNQPYSLDFNDVYFNSEDGLAETQYVFIEKNDLINRFKNLQAPAFTILETGFGTGLNFLAVSALWLELAPHNAILHYVGIEKLPLSLPDLTRAHALWPQFSEVSDELKTSYAKLKSGTNLFSIAAGRIQLALQADDIMLALPKLLQKGDAWLLDGFAPAKNVDMWSSQVFAHIARLSKANTTFATFTSASAVRRGLQAAGFTVEKHAGFGKKREMLSGVFTL